MTGENVGCEANRIFKNKTGIMWKIKMMGFKEENITKALETYTETYVNFKKAYQPRTDVELFATAGNCLIS